MQAPFRFEAICSLCVNDMSKEDVPSPVDFHDRAHVEAWIRDTLAAKPWRSKFFDAFVFSLNRHFARSFTVLEIGSGPGHLAERILSECKIVHYTALDFSAVMHKLGSERLSIFRDRVEFLQQDFLEPNWQQNLGAFDAVVTLQAAHEVRHVRRQPALFSQIRSVLKKNGIFLYCDHYASQGSRKNPDLFLRPEAQAALLTQAGFLEVEKLYDESEMALYKAVNSL